jgi:hypothetical protein
VCFPGGCGESESNPDARHEPIEQLRPELEIQRHFARDRAALRGGADPLLPVIWLHDQVEQRRGRRIANLDHLELDAEEVDALTSVLVQPVQCLPVLLPESGGNPNDPRSNSTPTLTALSHNHTTLPTAIALQMGNL